MPPPYVVNSVSSQHSRRSLAQYVVNSVSSQHSRRRRSPTQYVVNSVNRAGVVHQSTQRADVCTIDTAFRLANCSPAQYVVNSVNRAGVVHQSTQPSDVCTIDTAFRLANCKFNSVSSQHSRRRRSPAQYVVNSVNRAGVVHQSTQQA